MKTGKFGMMQSETKEKKKRLPEKPNLGGGKDRFFFLELSRDSRMLTTP